MNYTDEEDMEAAIELASIAAALPHLEFLIGRGLLTVITDMVHPTIHIDSIVSVNLNGRTLDLWTETASEKRTEFHSHDKPGSACES